MKPLPSAPIDETAWVRRVMERVLEECPERRPTSEDEHRAQRILAEQYEALGVPTAWHRFRFNDNLYANLVLHNGISVLASALGGVAPALAAAMQLTTATSYVAESTRAAYLLRRLFPWGPSQNLLATLPSRGPLRLRVVFVSHADTAYTGLLFEPDFVKRMGHSPPPFHKSMRIVIGAQLASAALAGVEAVRGRRLPGSGLLRAALALPSLAAFALNVDVVRRDTIVPGANDNLSGAVGGLLLARRLLADRPDGVEVVFVTTGCEEASLGGADALARSMRSTWSTDDTVVVGIDGFANGELFYFEEGEVLPVPLDARLRECLEDVAATDDRFAIAPFDIPVGGSDAVPFALRGYPAVCIGRVDPELGMPRHYHHPTDTLENMDVRLIPETVDYVEAVFRELVARRVT